METVDTEQDEQQTETEASSGETRKPYICVYCGEPYTADFSRWRGFCSAKHKFMYDNDVPLEHGKLANPCRIKVAQTASLWYNKGRSEYARRLNNHGGEAIG